MTRKTEGAEASRRDFLKLAGTAAPVAVIAAATGSAAHAAPAEADLGLTVLQDTAHTRAYIDSARF